MAEKTTETESRNATATATVRAKGALTVPAPIRKATHLEEGDQVEIEVIEEGILLRPLKVIDATQAWYWTPEWQAGERQAMAEAAAGLGTVYETEEEFFAALEDD